jgi:hypothetical protein
MKINRLRDRLQAERPMTMVSLRIPEDVVEDLKRIAPLLGFSGYQPLIRAYIGQGLRSDLERLEGSIEITALVESLRRQGIEDRVIAAAVAEAKGPTYTTTENL